MSAPDLRASDADRDRVAIQLREYLADGRLTLDEFAERVDAAHTARTVGQLEELTRDLPVGQTAERTSAVASPRRWSVAVMGENRLAGSLACRRVRRDGGVMGNCVVDLTQARLEAPEVVVTAVALMGNVQVIAPEGADVDLSGFALMGNKVDRTADVDPVLGAPRVRVRAFALMGNVFVRSSRRRAR